MIKDEFFKKEILKFYSWVETIIENSNGFGYTDINISLESLIVKLLNLLDLGDYTNCNAISIIYPTIDLFDEKSKIGIQITSDCSSKKIEKTFCNRKDYNIKFFFLNSKYKPRKKTFDKYKNFNDNDILNFKKCLVIAEQNNKLEQLYKFLKDNIILPINTELLSIKDGYDVYEKNFFLNNMKEICNKFVPTSITGKCMKHLENNNLLILIGNPGVGKTYNSYFLTAKLIEQGYILLHSPNNNLKDILKKYNKEDKFVLFIDDVFGSNEKNFMVSLREDEIVSLIESKNDNLKIIINSRCSIFEEVNNEFDKIERLKLKPFMIEVSDFTCLEKARILIKHLEYNRISKDKIKQLFEEDKFLFNNYPSKQKIFKILFHKNYNPRAIDEATKNVQDNMYNLNEYILRVLNNPFLIYEHTYNSNLDDNDRDVLKIIYIKSRSNFDNVINTSEIIKLGSLLNISENSIKLSLRKLEKSFICQYISESGKSVCKYYNPSILDFCKDLFDNSYDMIKFADLIDDPNDLKNIIKNKNIDDSKKIQKILDLKYSDYDDIKMISSENIKNNKDFIDYLINDIFENQKSYYYGIDYFCSDEYIDDHIVVDKIENSDMISKYISFNNGNPRYTISKRILKLLNNFSDKKRNDIFRSISEELHSEIVSSIDDYIFQSKSIDDCQPDILNDLYKETENEVFEDFKSYLNNSSIDISLDELNEIFSAYEFDFSEYEDAIDSRFQNDNDNSNQILSDDEKEAVIYLKEYSETL